jgi:trimeric autotransporter adhesin
MKIKISIFYLLVTLFYQLQLQAQTWHAIGNGVGSSQSYNFTVSCVKTIDNILYVGGDFKTEFGAPGDGIAQFNGSNWDSLNCTDGIYPYSLEKYDDGDIYAVGSFLGICNDYTCYNMGKWNGVSWSKISDSSAFGLIYTCASYKNELYIGGDFSKIGTLTVKKIARWDGANWHDVGGGVWDPLPYLVHAMAIYNGELIVAGAFQKAGGDTVNNVAAWDGNEWHSLARGTNNVVWALYTDTITNLLYAGGNFTSVDDSIQVPYIACWDGQKWQKLKDSTNTFHGIRGVYAISRFNNRIYVGGTNSTADTVLVRWDGSHWENMTGFTGHINALSVYKGNLYAGGGFSSIGGDTTIKYIACYGDSCPENVGIHEIITDKTEYLWQNIPNPFNNTTSIPYYVPDGSKGVMQIMDANGKHVKEFVLQHGKNDLDVSLENLKSGIYFYSIKIDGKIMQTKKMMLE